MRTSVMPPDGFKVTPLDLAERGTYVEQLVARGDELKALIEAGYGYHGIDKLYEVSYKPIMSACKQLGLRSRHNTNKWVVRRDEIQGWLNNGYSYSVIAHRLGTTRGAVAGLCHRLKLTSDPIGIASRRAARARKAKPRIKTAKVKRASENKRKPLFKLPPRPRMLEPEPDAALRCTLLELERGRCHYIRDDGFYCGAPTGIETGQWCRYHAQICLRGLSSDVGGSPAAASRDGGRAGGDTTARPHPIKPRWGRLTADIAIGAYGHPKEDAA